MKKIETVLIGTSLTEASDQVVRTGLKVARAAKARVVLAHGCSPQREVVQAEKESLRRKMEDQAHRLGIRPEERAGTILDLGPAHQMLIETAGKTGADLIVVGAAEAPCLAKLLGSTADRVMRKATCPVLVVRRELPMPLARVLLPVDLSLPAQAFREGLEILGFLAGERKSGATQPELEALYVLTDLDRHLYTPEEAPERSETYTLEDLDRFIARHAADSAFEVVPRTVSGCVENEILLHIRRIREWEPDLVVLGTHGRSGFERFLLGSVAAKIVRDGGANVLIMPPATARKQAVAMRAAVEQEALVA